MQRKAKIAAGYGISRSSTRKQMGGIEGKGPAPALARGAPPSCLAQITPPVPLASVAGEAFMRAASNALAGTQE